MFATELEQLNHAIRSARRIMITATEREDGDSIAAELGIRRIIEQAFPDSSKIIHVINERPCPPRYRFLTGAAEILPLDMVSDPRYDAGIVVDCGADRAGRVRPVFEHCPFRVRIDHHAVSNSGDYSIEIVSTEVAATTEILFAFVEDPVWRVTLDTSLAELIYVGILCDTSFAMKKLLGLVLDRMQRPPHGKYLWSVLTEAMMRAVGAGPDDAGDIIDELCFIHGVEVSLLFVEQPEETVRISFRSRGGVHVGHFARRISPSGGGHPRASGCVLPGRLDAVVPFICGQLEEEMRRLGLL
jgi:phosphoesterase RecJ-like protein